MAYHRLEKSPKKAQERRDYMRIYMRLYRRGESPAQYRKYKGCSGENKKKYIRDYMRKYMREYREIRGYLAGRDRLDYNSYMSKYMKKYRSGGQDVG